MLRFSLMSFWRNIWLLIQSRSRFSRHSGLLNWEKIVWKWWIFLMECVAITEIWRLISKSSRIINSSSNLMMKSWSTLTNKYYSHFKKQSRIHKHFFRSNLMNRIRYKWGRRNSCSIKDTIEKNCTNKIK